MCAAARASDLRMTRFSRLVVVGAAACSAARVQPPAAPPHAAAPAPAPVSIPVAAPPSTTDVPGAVASTALADAERSVVAEPVTYVFRASRMTNLLYVLDCLAGLQPCSTAAFATSWPAAAWKPDDDSAIAAWKLLHHARGSVGDHAAQAGPPLPLPYHAHGVADAVVVAGYGARDLDDYAARLAVLVNETDTATARAIAARFESRASDRWQATRAGLVAALEEYVALAARPDVRVLAASIARLYRVPAGGMRQTFELVARPRHASGSNARQLGDLGVVEVTIGDAVTHQFAVVTHEMFHAWFAASPIEDQIALVERFASSADPIATAAYGMLDEALATALGNGLVARAVTPAEYEQRARIPRGLYDDRFIDAVAKALLPALEARLAAGRSVFDDDFVPEYLRAVHTGVPDGLPPIAHLRPMACAMDPSLHEAARYLQQVSRASHVESTDGAPEAAELFRQRRAWGKAILWTRSNLAALRPLVDQATLAALRRQAKAGAPFVLTMRGSPGGFVFVLIADDDAAARKLIDAFAAQPRVREGVFVP